MFNKSCACAPTPCGRGNDPPRFSLPFVLVLGEVEISFFTVTGMGLYF